MIGNQFEAQTVQCFFMKKYLLQLIHNKKKKNMTFNLYINIFFSPDNKQFVDLTRT